MLPAGILLGLFFDKKRPQYMNYGAIGWALGHEISHGFDVMGSQYDASGNFVDWWKTKTKEKYLKKVKCIIEQYGNYTIRDVGSNVSIVRWNTYNYRDLNCQVMFAKFIFEYKIGRYLKILNKKPH